MESLRAASNCLIKWSRVVWHQMLLLIIRYTNLNTLYNFDLHGFEDVKCLFEVEFSQANDNKILPFVWHSVLQLTCKLCTVFEWQLCWTTGLTQVKESTFICLQYSFSFLWLLNPYCESDLLFYFSKFF